MPRLLQFGPFTTWWHPVTEIMGPYTNSSKTLPDSTIFSSDHRNLPLTLKLFVKSFWASFMKCEQRRLMHKLWAEWDLRLLAFMKMLVKLFIAMKKIYSCLQPCVVLLLRGSTHKYYHQYWILQCYCLMWTVILF